MRIPFNPRHNLVQAPARRGANVKFDNHVVKHPPEQLPAPQRTHARTHHNAVLNSARRMRQPRNPTKQIINDNVMQSKRKHIMIMITHEKCQ